MNKVLGYVLAILGIVGLLLTVESIKKILGIALPAFLSTTMLTTLSIILLAIGLFILIKLKQSSVVKEVPIYHGKEVVGYRRVVQ